MLIYKNLYLHNIYDYTVHSDYVEFFRFPNSLKSDLESSGDFFGVLQGAELRFIIKGTVKLTLSSLNKESFVVIYYGDHQEKIHVVNTTPTEIVINNHPFNSDWLDTINNNKSRFNPLLVRVVLYERIVLNSISGNYTLP